MTSFDTLYEYAREFDLEKYGTGVPFVFFLLWAALIYRTFHGINTYYQMNFYGKFGVVVLLAISAVCLWLSGYTYRAVDTTQWFKTEEEDKEELVPQEG